MSKKTVIICLSIALLLGLVVGAVFILTGVGKKKTAEVAASAEEGAGNKDAAKDKKKDKKEEAKEPSVDARKRMKQEKTALQDIEKEKTDVLKKLKEEDKAEIEKKRRADALDRWINK